MEGIGRKGEGERNIKVECDGEEIKWLLCWGRPVFLLCLRVG